MFLMVWGIIQKFTVSFKFIKLFFCEDFIGFGFNAHQVLENISNQTRLLGSLVSVFSIMMHE